MSLDENFYMHFLKMWINSIRKLIQQLDIYVSFWQDKITCKCVKTLQTKSSTEKRFRYYLSERFVKMEHKLGKISLMPILITSECVNCVYTKVDNVEQKFCSIFSVQKTVNNSKTTTTTKA